MSHTKNITQYLYTLYLLFFITLFSYWIRPYIGYHAIGFLYIVNILLVGSRGSFGPVFFSSIAGALLWNFIFIPPFFTLHISAPEDGAMILSFLLVGLLSGYLVQKTKIKEKELIESEQKASALFNLLRDFSTAMDAKSICKLTEKNIRDLLRINVKIFLADDNFTQINNSKDDAISISSSGKILASLLINKELNAELSIDEKNLLQSICLQLGNALEHICLLEENKNILLLQESEKLHQTLLNSVSHELRIPLTTIIGTVNTLQDPKIQTDPGKIKFLNSELLEASDRLNRVIENILDMNRLDSGLLTLKKEWIEAIDLIQSLINQFKTKNHKIAIKELSDDIYLYCDIRLFEHALLNLLLNAIAYSPEGSLITIEIEKIKDHIFIRFMDEGPGIPFDKLTVIFNKFYRIPGSPTGGIGLGLSIVRGIIEAHAGLVFANNRTDQTGAVFTIELPWVPLDKKLSEV